MMNKLLWTASVILFLVLVVKFSFDQTSQIGSSLGSAQTTSEVNLANGGSMQMTAEESALKVSSEEKKIVLLGLGMTCSSCKAAVSAGLKNSKGVNSFYVNLGQDRATAVFDPNQTDIESIKQSVADVGYEAGEVKEVE